MNGKADRRDGRWKEAPGKTETFLKPELYPLKMTGLLETKIKPTCAHFKFYILNLSVLDHVSFNLTMFVGLSLSNNAHQILVLTSHEMETSLKKSNA